jgi:SWIB/MDM2 domain
MRMTRSEQDVERIEPGPPSLTVKRGGMIASVIGSTAVERTEVVRKLLSYIRQKGLQDDADPALVHTDAALQKICGRTPAINIFKLVRIVNDRLRTGGRVRLRRTVPVPPRNLKVIAGERPKTTQGTDCDRITAAAIRTAKWATVMSKWHIGFDTHGKSLTNGGVSRALRWQLIAFPGAGRWQSAPTVDLMAVRKAMTPAKVKVSGSDVFEVILIRIKTGSEKKSTPEEIRRLRAIAKRYNARDVVLAEWLKGCQQRFYRLAAVGDDPRKAWSFADPGDIFR